MRSGVGPSSWGVRFATVYLVFVALAVGGAQGSEPDSDSFYLEGHPAVVDMEIVGTLLGPGGPGDALWESGQILTDVGDHPMCMAHGLSRWGQGAYYSGSVGGLVLGSIEVPASGGATVASYPVAAFLNGNVSSQGYSSLYSMSLQHLLSRQSLSGDVVIVVADDFGGAIYPGGIYEVPSGLFQLQSQDAEDPQDAAKRLQSVLAAEPVSHGALVLHHLNALIDATGVFEANELYPDQGRFVWVAKQGDLRLTVQALDLSANLEVVDGQQFAKIDSLTIARAIDRVVDNEATVIVNMSWVLIPCATVEDFIANRELFLDMHDYLEAMYSQNEWLWSLGEAEFNSNALKLLGFAGRWDPLYQEIAHLQDKVLFVASSGNFDMSYQMIPAGWPWVLGVGSPRGDNPPPAFSNASEISAPGAWFRLEPLGSSSSTEDFGGVSYSGTSFSSPMLALYLAVDVAAGGDCVVSTPNSLSTRLARTDLSSERALGEVGDAVSPTCR